MRHMYGSDKLVSHTMWKCLKRRGDTSFLPPPSRREEEKRGEERRKERKVKERRECMCGEGMS